MRVSMPSWLAHGLYKLFFAQKISFIIIIIEPDPHIMRFAFYAVMVLLTGVFVCINHINFNRINSIVLALAQGLYTSFALLCFEPQWPNPRTDQSQAIILMTSRKDREVLQVNRHGFLVMR